MVYVDTAMMQAAAQQSAAKADNMLGHAKTLRAGIDFVVQRWQGQAGEAFRNAMQNQTALLDQLIQKLQFASETVKRGAQGFESQDADGRAQLIAQGQKVITTPLNF
jgi:WXG100 family type VII secretion target